MTTPASSDSGRGQESDTEAYASSEAGSGQDAAFVNSLSTPGNDAALGVDTQSVFVTLQLLAAADVGTGTEGWATGAPVADFDAGTGSDSGTDSLVLSVIAVISSEAGSGQDVVGPIGIWPFPPAWLFPLPGGSFILIWRPGTSEEMLVRTFPLLDQNTMRYTQIIRDADDLQMPTDSDVGTGSESTLPTATVVQYALGALVTCGVPS